MLHTRIQSACKFSFSKIFELGLLDDPFVFFLPVVGFNKSFRRLNTRCYFIVCSISGNFSNIES